MKEYFPHDYQASEDKKIGKLKIKLGHEGVGIFWELVEFLHRTKNQEYLVEDISILAFELRVKEETLKSVLFDFELFESDGVKFWSNRIRENLLKRQEIIDKRAEAGRKGMASRWGKNNTVITSNNKAITKNNKEKEKKGKKRKRNEKKEEKIIKKEKHLDFVFLSSEEEKKLYKALGQLTTEDYIERLNNYIGSHGKEYKSHYHTILSWWRKNKNSPKDDVKAVANSPPQVFRKPKKTMKYANPDLIE